MSAYNPVLPWDQQEPNCVLILDNARVHDHIAVAVAEAAGVMVRFLPPYSPDLTLWRTCFRWAVAGYGVM